MTEFLEQVDVLHWSSADKNSQGRVVRHFASILFQRFSPLNMNTDSAATNLECNRSDDN